MTMFLKDYTAKQLNRGVSMMFHPLTRNPLSQLEYHKQRAEFVWYRPVPRILWDHDERWDSLWQGRIGNGKAEYHSGDSYPSHWIYDPWTGQTLRTTGKHA